MEGVRVGPQDQRQDEETRGDEQIANPNEHGKLVAWRRQTARKNRQPVWRHAARPRRIDANSPIRKIEVDDPQQERNDNRREVNRSLCRVAGELSACPRRFLRALYEFAELASKKTDDRGDRRERDGDFVNQLERGSEKARRLGAEHRCQYEWLQFAKGGKNDEENRPADESGGIARDLAGVLHGLQGSQQSPSYAQDQQDQAQIGGYSKELEVEDVELLQTGHVRVVQRANVWIQEECHRSRDQQERHDQNDVCNQSSHVNRRIVQKVDRSVRK